jgi:hypothetical protein
VLDVDKLKDRMVQRVGAGDAQLATAEVAALTKAVIKDPQQLVGVARDKLPLLSRLYSTCTSTVENAGHRFGEGLPANDKQALTAFLATL